jgi:hypothetical protein
MEVKEPTLRTLINRSENKEFVLPNFQRDYVWPVENQKKLIATFLVNLPSGNFLTLEGESGDFVAREVCNKNSIVPTSNCFYLLDGQQRFSTLKNAFFNLYGDDPQNWKLNWKSLFSNLRYRFFISLTFNDNHDYFGLKNLSFDESSFNKLEPSMLEEKIIEKKILDKERSKFFHPGYNPIDSSGNPLPKPKRQLTVAKELSESFWIPLFDLSNNSPQTLIDTVLRLISRNRIDVLKLENLSDVEIINLLEKIDPNIDEYLINEMEKEIEDTWNNLASTWAHSVSNFLKTKLDNPMVELQLKRDEVDRAFAIFEVINKPGTPLDEYDLIVARAARDINKDQLSMRIVDELQKKITLPNSLKYRLNGKTPTEFIPITIGSYLENIISQDLKTRFLQILSIIAHCKQRQEILSIDHLKRGKILKLTTEEINDNFEIAITAVLRAYAFLHYRCGVVSIEQIPYKLMIIPIAFQFLDDKSWKNKKANDKIEYWYWSSLFGGYYKMDQYNQALNDISSLEKFIQNKPNNIEVRRSKIFNVDDYCNDRIILGQDLDNTLNPNIDKAILQYIISNQPMDFLKKGTNLRITTWDVANQNSFTYKSRSEILSLEDHHICPLAGKKKIGETNTSEIRKAKKEILNSPANRTLISKTSNRELAIFEPKDYFEYINDSSKHNHCIPGPVSTVYEKNGTESDDEFYYRVCNQRLQDIKLKIDAELLSFLNI